MSAKKKNEQKPLQNGDQMVHKKELFNQPAWLPHFFDLFEIRYNYNRTMTIIPQNWGGKKWCTVPWLFFLEKKKQTCQPAQTILVFWLGDKM